MVTTSTHSLLGSAPGELGLLMCAAGRDGQVVHIQSSKCTIGSSPNCTLRLQAKGVRPVHCAILRGAAATVVRRFAPDTRLNGQAFTDAVLTLGDRLSIGPVELEIVKLEQLDRQTPESLVADLDARKQSLDAERDRWKEQCAEHEATLARQREEIQARQSELAHCVETLQTERTRWEAERADAQQQLHRRGQELDARQTELEAQHSAFETERGQWEAERLIAQAEVSKRLQDVAFHLAELDAQERAIQRQCSQQEAQRADVEQQLARRSEALEARHAEIEAQRSSFEADRDQWRAERAQHEADCNERSRQFDGQQSEIESQRQAFEEERRRWQAERAEMVSRFDEQYQQVQADREACRQEREALEEERRQWQAQRAATSREPETAAAEPAQPQDPVAEQAVVESPVDVSAVLARLGRKPLLPDEESPAAGAVEPESGQAGPAAAAEPASEEAGQHGEESVEQYMARLMERVRRTSPGQASSRAEAPPPAPPAPAVLAPVPPPGDAWKTAVPSFPAQERAAGKISPRTAPEQMINLAAMRELANVSAQTAIDRHARHLLLHSIWSKAVVFLVAFLIGLGLLSVWGFSGGGVLLLVGGLASVLVCMLWGVQYVMLARRFVLNKPNGHGAAHDPQPASGVAPTVPIASSGQPRIAEEERQLADREPPQ